MKPASFKTFTLPEDVTLETVDDLMKWPLFLDLLEQFNDYLKGKNPSQIPFNPDTIRTDHEAFLKFMSLYGETTIWSSIQAIATSGDDLNKVFVQWAQEHYFRNFNPDTGLVNAIGALSYSKLVQNWVAAQDVNLRSGKKADLNGLRELLQKNEDMETHRILIDNIDEYRDLEESLQQIPKTKQKVKILLQNKK